MGKGAESWLGPRQLVVTGDPTMPEHENYEFTLSPKSQQGIFHLASRGYFVSQHRMANPRVSVPLTSFFEGLSKTKVETTSSLASCAKVNFTLKASFGINSFYFLK